jgi:acetyltransferase-like isoleucine patch superfamily enzyme
MTSNCAYRLARVFKRSIDYVRNQRRLFVLQCKGVAIGSNVSISGNVLIEPSGASVRLGESVKLDYGVIIRCHGGELEIGSKTFLNAHVMIIGGGKIKIGSNTAIASYTILVASNHIFSDLETLIYDQGLEMKGIEIGDNVWIGVGCRILDGVKIGSGAVIGAGSVVTKSIAPNSIAVGVPAKVVKKRTKKNG